MMTMDRISARCLTAYARRLRLEERSAGTIEKYLRDTEAFAAWLDGRAVTRELAAEWKAVLLDRAWPPPPSTPCWPPATACWSSWAGGSAG